MQVEFTRGWGPYLAGQVFDLPDPLAAIHVAMGRARKAEPEPQAAPAPKPGPAAPQGKPARKR